MHCHNCAGQLRIAPGYERMHRVSSDCKPFGSGGQMGICLECGLVQAATDARWQREADTIYESYDLYHQSGGEEQPLFDLKTGRGRPRSEILIEELIQSADLPTTGRLLDIGCGNGAFLKACSRKLPAWKLAGLEINDRHQTAVESIPGVEKLHCGSIENIPGTFDVISVIHVLEHIPAPTAFLKSLASKLKPNGWLLVVVPDCSTNPFMLLVADHSSHFSPSTLSTVVTSAGFELIRSGPPWVAKEIGLLARPPQRSSESQQTYGNWEFLRGVVREVSELASHRPFGIFGTSIGATWLNAQTGRAAAFFVDEDPHRIGKQHAERPVLGVREIAPGATVYIALPPAVAERIAQRLRGVRPDVTFLTPESITLSRAAA